MKAEFKKELSDLIAKIPASELFPVQQAIDDIAFWSAAYISAPNEDMKKRATSNIGFCVSTIESYVSLTETQTAERIRAALLSTVTKLILSIV